MQGPLNGVFTHIFMDEASQAWEPEAMIPLSIMNDFTRVMLAGDPKQLGPATRCHRADRYGLGLSLQERLMNNLKYRPHIKYMVQLNRNYRNHSSMLKISSRRFYGGENALLACADPKKIDRSLSWHRLRGNAFPILFLDVKNGKHTHSIDSRSLKNVAEAHVVVETVKDILNDKKLSYTTNDIGVIASFRAQVLLLRKLLRNVGLNAIRVGSIDDYQGQEENVIILSTVYAGLNRHKTKECIDLGLLGNARRFNVAVTRASSLLVVVGNSNSIRQDPSWRDLIMVCKENHTIEVIGTEDGKGRTTREEEEEDEKKEATTSFPYAISKKKFDANQDEKTRDFMPWRVMM